MASISQAAIKALTRINEQRAAVTEAKVDCEKEIACANDKLSAANEELARATEMVKAAANEKRRAEEHCTMVMNSAQKDEKAFAAAQAAIGAGLAAGANQISSCASVQLETKTRLVYCTKSTVELPDPATTSISEVEGDNADDGPSHDIVSRGHSGLGLKEEQKENKTVAAHLLACTNTGDSVALEDASTATRYSEPEGELQGTGLESLRPTTDGRVPTEEEEKHFARDDKPAHGTICNNEPPCSSVCRGHLGEGANKDEKQDSSADRPLASTAEGSDKEEDDLHVDRLLACLVMDD